MVFDIDVRSNIKEFKAGLTRAEKKQLPYVTMVTLTNTAWAVRDHIAEQSPKRFEVTKTWWKANQPTGYKVLRATKTKKVAEVFTGAYFLPLQNTGGLKLAKRGGLLVPTKHAPKSAKTAKGLKRILSGKRILRKGGKPGGHPVMMLNSGKAGVFRRKTKKRLPIVMLYSYRRSVNVKPALDYEYEASRQVILKMPHLFSDAMKRAFNVR